MSGPVTMASKVQAYLADRRRCGYALKIEGAQLMRFARFADATGYRGPLTTEVARRWATASRRGRRITAARRIEVLRSFARYCQSFDPLSEIPPLHLFGPGHRRLVPHIYTQAEIRALMQAALDLPPLGGLRGATCATVFGLIAACGLRISEAMGLKRADVRFELGHLLVRHAKYGKSRLLPLHPTTLGALRRYVRRRDRDPASGSSDSFFMFDNGRVPSAANIRWAFTVLRKLLRWKARGGHPNLRIHDLRHTFVCRRLERWYAEGQDIDRHLHALSTYVGHVNVSDTYWYITATPDLLARAAQRLAPPVSGGGP